MQYACKKLFNQWIEINCLIKKNKKQKKQNKNKKKKNELELKLKIFKLI